MSHTNDRRPDPDPLRPIPTHQELAVQIVRDLFARDWTLNEVAAVLVAEHQSGCLRTNAPAWVRQTASFLSAHGKLHTDLMRAEMQAFAAEKSLPRFARENQRRQ